MMTPAEILAKLRQTYVEGIRAWDQDHDAFMADLERRVGCLSVELAKVGGAAVGMRNPRGDVHYYEFELPVRAPPGRSRITIDDVEAVSGEATYLVAYGSSILPLVEVRWHVITLDDAGKLRRMSCDLLDQRWLDGHPRESELALRVVDAAERCGWQILGPDLAEQEPPDDWPWPFPTYDYQDGQYLLRDYIIKGMRDY